ncbi:MAG TPA: hypothetical protein VHE59_15720 [Mucilaginibacter sp.]|nr:hypothetical protein [Mucilaginibacter sp.]
MNNSKTFIAYYPADRNFFLVLLLFTWAAIISGFGYDMVQLNAQGKLHFPLVVHMHAVVYTAWLVLFTVQVLLVRTKNLALHKRLGLLSLGLIPVMLILGLLVIITVSRLQYGTPDSDLHFICIQFGNMLMFACFAGTGVYLRKNYVAHKRLMLLSTLVLTEPGFARWLGYKISPLFGNYFWTYTTVSQGFWRFWTFDVLPTFALVLALGVYDLVTRKRLTKVYVWALALYLLVTTSEGFLYYSDTWFSLMKHMIGVK